MVAADFPSRYGSLHEECTAHPGCGDQSLSGVHGVSIQPFSQKSRTPTVAKEFQIGLYDPAEADLEHFWDSCSAGFFGERLYVPQSQHRVAAARTSSCGMILP